ncbi:phosphatase PAP2 family protein [Pseudomonas sp. TH10]|uniref:acid phosphatase n=1 Tax=Pseudomonas sp. TH10 TaxID=2796376 RepID=UPI00191250CC|nr:phosphatase PAP2 family protein [Pseudomonas sp. TH10]MBK5517248.1 phosphatase PAP2 family protein [Pseudomonas sp. TH10]
MTTYKKNLLSILTGLAIAGFALAAPDSSTRVTGSENVPEIRPGLLAGYLGKDLPDSHLLLPPPPAMDSSAFNNDQAVSRASQQLRDTPRYTQAVKDADLSFPAAASTFSCALGISINQKDTPRLYVLLRRTMTDAGLATYGAKNYYSQVRPFVYFKEATCTPSDEGGLRKDGSYPSGHTSVGWAWALVLSELAPDRTNALLARGRAYGEVVWCATRIGRAIFWKVVRWRLERWRICIPAQLLKPIWRSHVLKSTRCDSKAASLMVTA